MKRLLSTLCLFLGISFLALFASSCSSNDDDNGNLDKLPTLYRKIFTTEREGVVMTFCLLNSKGDTTVTFAPGEEIIFDLKIENTTDENILLAGGPFTLGYNTFRIFTLAGEDCGTSWTYPHVWTKEMPYLFAYRTYHYQCPWYSEDVIKATSPFIFKSPGKRLTRGSYFTEAYCHLDNGTVLHCIHYFNVQ